MSRKQKQMNPYFVLFESAEHFDLFNVMYYKKNQYFMKFNLLLAEKKVKEYYNFVLCVYYEWNIVINVMLAVCKIISKSKISHNL